MTQRDRILQQVEDVSDEDLGMLGEYLAFLRFRSRVNSMPIVDQARLRSLYGEFTEEDRELANQGLDDYERLLRDEDFA